MPETIITILDVEGRDVNTSRGPGRVFNVKGSDGRRYSTFNAKLAQEAVALKGQGAKIEFETRQKGEFTNYDLKALEAASVVQTVETSSNGSQGVTTVPVASQGPSDKDTQIARAVALKAAVELVAAGTAEKGIFELAEEILSWLQQKEERERHQTSDPGGETVWEGDKDSDGILVKF